MKKYKIFQDNFDANIIESSPSTYVIFYKKEERKSDFPPFETWIGTLKTV